MALTEFNARQRAAWRFAMSLTLLRAVLAPTLVLLAWSGAPGWTLAVAVTAAFLSDVFDGVVARRGNAVTPGLRRADSLVDILFYVTVAATAWLWYRDVISPWSRGVVLVLVGEVLSNGLSFVRFRRDASYHAWTARIWGLTLFVAVVAMFAFHTGALIPLVVAAAVIAQAEAIAITLLLPAWRTDVRSVRDAWRARNGER